MTAGPIIIGDPNDPHVRGVVSRLDPSALVIDAARLSELDFELVGGVMRVADENGVLHMLDASRARRGWIRRIAPADWYTGVAGESRESAEKTAWLTLLTSILRTVGVSWLSDIDSIVRAENKLVVDWAARAASVPMPRTVVTNRLANLNRHFETEILLKPLGPGHFIEGGIPFNVFAEKTPLKQVRQSDLEVSPFIAQEFLRAVRHHRIVTVEGQAWGASLEAEDLPADWREVPKAHSDFRPGALGEEMERQAISIARQLKLGFSSQDWIETADGSYLVDVNPSGQWLFLPITTADPVTNSIARWLNA